MTKLIELTSDMDKLIGKRIRIERQAVGMTQETLARKLGITFQQVQKYEKGANRVAVGTLILIARAIGVQPISLFRTVAVEIDGMAA